MDWKIVIETAGGPEQIVSSTYVSDGMKKCFELPQSLLYVQI